MSASIFSTPLSEMSKAKCCHEKLIAALQDKYPSAEKIEIEKRAAHYLVGRWGEFICNPPLKQRTKDWLYWVDPITRTLYFRDNLSATVRPGYVQVRGYEGADLSCLVDLLQALNWHDAKVLITGAEGFQRGMTNVLRSAGVGGIPDSGKVQAEIGDWPPEIEKKGGSGGAGGQEQVLSPEPDWNDLGSLSADELLQLSQEAAEDGDIETIEDIQDELRRRQEARLSLG